jgi:glycosyltransferase involved in cell wall biosynthesis
MRVLHVISDIAAAAGGVTSAVVGLAIAQRRAGMDVAVLSTWRAELDQTNVDLLQSAGVTLRTVGPAQGRLMRHPDLATAVDESVAGADIVHIAALWEEIHHAAAATARRRKVPYIFSPHGMLDPWSLARNRWVKRLYLAWRLRRDLNGAAAIHFTCAVERDLVLKMGLKPAAIVEPNGLDLREFDNLPADDVFRRQYPQVGTRPIVLFLSRIDPKKGLDLLIPAFARVPAETVLVIAGPDLVGYRAEVEQQVKEFGLTERVVFTGMLRGADRIAAMAAARLFVLPSYQENFGIVVAESLAAGVPVVISDQVNIHAEITRAKVGGVVVTEVLPLANEMNRWLTDDTLRSGAASKCRPFAQQYYDWQQIAGRWRGHYERLRTESR